MIGGIAVIMIAVWFYKSAQALGKNPVLWALIGALSYFIPALLWTLQITPGLRDMVSHNQSILLAWFIRLAYVVIGLICAVWVKKKHLDAHSSKNDQPAG